MTQRILGFSSSVVLRNLSRFVLQKLLIGILVLTSLSAFSSTYVLFKKTVEGKVVPAQNYGQIIRSLAPGDVIEFSEGHRFTLGPYKSGFSSYFQHGRNIILPFLEGPGFLLRVPKKTETQFSIDYYLVGEAILDLMEVNHAEIIAYKKSEFIIVREVKNYITMKQFLAETTSSKLFLEAGNALVEFGRSVALFAEIGDYRANQLVYDLDSRKWILLDWDHSHRLGREVQVAVRGTGFSQDISDASFLRGLLFEIKDLLHGGKLLKSSEDRILEIFDRVLIAVQEVRRENFPVRREYWQKKWTDINPWDHIEAKAGQGLCQFAFIN